MSSRFVLFFLLFSAAVDSNEAEYSFETRPSNVISTEDETRIRGFRDNAGKDFVIGGLFAVHSPAAGSAGGRCSETILQSGVERIEAFLYALDMVNNDTELLRNVVLGYDIRDTCVSENIALDETAHLVFPSYLDSPDQQCMETVSSGDTTPGSPQGNTTTNDVLAIIGPTSSQVSLSVASLLRLFTVPQISYSASSPTLNNRDRYGYFYRTHPPDNQEVRAMIDLALSFGWTYLSMIHSNNAYGDPASEIFEQMANEVGICIHMNIGLEDSFKPVDYFNAANRLVNESDPSVVVVFASLMYVEEFMEQLSIIQAGGDAREFVWIASSAWAQATTISTKYPDIISGLLGLEANTNTESNFNQYFSQLTLDSNQRNPWFPEYYQDYFNCRVSSNSCNRTTPVTSHPDYVQRDYIELVIDAVYTIAHALDSFITNSCDNTTDEKTVTQTCRDQLNGTVLRDYLNIVNFTSPSGNRIVFDAEGNIDGRYKFVNFQRDNSTGAHHFVPVGIWSDNGGITLFDDVSIQYGPNTNQRVQSQCQECPMGNFRTGLQLLCCGLCEPCLGSNYTNSTSSTQCTECPEGSWGNEPLTGNDACNKIPEIYLNHSDPFGIVLILMAIGGLISVIVVIVGMGIFWTTPVIKSSGREQMILILVGVTASFLAIVLYLVRPSFGVCLVQRFADTTPFTLMLSALLIKLVRITRIFLNKSNAKTRFIDWKYQYLFTAPLVAVQLVLIVISLIVAHPDVVTTQISNSDNSLDTPTVLLQCNQGNIVLSILQILYLGILLVVTNFIGVLTLRFPDNFNESRYVTFATLSMFLIWLTYLQTYFAVMGYYQTAILPFTLQLVAISILGCFFFTRIYKAIMVRRDDLKSTGGSSAIPLTNSTNSRLSIFKGLSISSKESRKDSVQDKPV